MSDPQAAPQQEQTAPTMADATFTTMLDCVENAAKAYAVWQEMTRPGADPQNLEGASKAAADALKGDTAFTTFVAMFGTIFATLLRADSAEGQVVSTEAGTMVVTYTVRRTVKDGKQTELPLT